MLRLHPILLLSLIAAVSQGGEPQADPAAHKENVEFFEKKIRPVLVEACYKCHSVESGKSKGGLLLDSREGLLKGGHTGPAVVPGDLERSLLIKAIRYEQDELEMPPMDRLSAQQIADFETWIKNGASDPRARTAPPPTPAETIDFEKARTFWSFQPVKEPAIPAVKDKAWPRNPIDAFILAKLEEKNIRPAPPADKRTLIRRATFDLTGLPPSPADIDAFLADTSPQAFEKVIDRLLASRHYGEAWGRHWLDLARYADTAGESADYPIPQAWRYRNYVIDAFNKDKPYDQFIREQIAGDLLPSTSEAEKHERIIATGFVASARRFSVDPDSVHHLTIEDSIDTMGRAILGLTLSCSRCHDHKFDPIPTSDYYALYGIFNSTRYPFPGSENKKFQRDFVSLATAEEMKPVLEYDKLIDAQRKEVERLEKEKKAIEAEPETGPKPRPALPESARGENLVSPDYVKDFRLGCSPDQAVRDVVAAENQPFTSALRITTKKKPSNAWEVQLSTQTIASIETGDVLVATFYARVCDAAPKTQAGAEIIVESTGPNYEQIFGQALKIGTEWTKFEFALLARKGFEAQKAQVNLRLGFGEHTIEVGGLDVKTYRKSLAGTEFVKSLQGNKKERINAARVTLEAERRKLEKLMAKAPEVPKAYALAEGTPQNVRIHLRGEPSKPGEEARRGFLQILGGQKLPESCKGSGRLELAGWLTDSKNPLTARVMVNRIWQYHFGKGLVQTPSDFGKQGRAPTHPELLDYLARRFVEGGWSIKAMHKMMMLSQTYQLASQYPAGEEKPEYAVADANNELLRKFNRRRLDAEEIRDALLALSGTLDATPGQAHPFEHPSKWGYTQHNQFFAVYETKKRSVYVMQQRLRRHPFFSTFDGADTNQTTAVRLISSTSLQALFMMNDKFAHEMAQSFARRVLGEGKDEAGCLSRAYQLAFGREASADEARQISAYLAQTRELDKLKALPEDTKRHAAWSGLARVMFSSNEFMFVD
ncbi:MAG TPA: PSD1 and planctomycete cytochrome C domain-containing protein [Planctomycetota bacterium]|nr:PSD1 and planctomycete cytochrome C domain-containing protein [Planctomycetota bacterium]